MAGKAEDHYITLSELMGDVRKVDVQWLQHEFWVKYKPSAMTPTFFAKTRQAALDAGIWGAEAVKIAVQSILIEWSLVDENRVMIPITEEALDGIALDAIWAIYNACVDDLHPKEETASSSNGISKPAATKA